MLYNAAINGRQLSVPQVIEMQGEKASLMASITGRIITEFLNPVIDAVDVIEYEGKRMPVPPQILQDLFRDEEIEVEYLGTLAQAQKRMVKVQAISQGLGALEGLIKLNPEVADNVDCDEAAVEVLRAMGFPAKAINDKAKVKQLRDQRQQAAAQQQKQQMMEKAAMAAPGLSKSIEPGSPLHGIMQKAGLGDENNPLANVGGNA